MSLHLITPPPLVEYLSDGISESLINRLSQLSGVKVIARSSSFKYKGQIEPREAAHALGVEAILTGRVLRRGDTLLISAELVDARDEAVIEMRRARDLDPLGRDANTSADYEYGMSRQPCKALEAAKKLVEMDPSNPNQHELLGGVYVWNKLYPEAIASFQEAIKLGDKSPDTQIELGQVYAKVGETKKAREILKQLESGKEYVSPIGLAILHLALGEREQTFALLERAYSAHDQQIIWLGVNGGFDSLRSDPRFQDLLRRIGLTAEPLRPAKE